MPTIKKQMKITKYRNRKASSPPEDCEELEEEVNQLEQQLKDKQNELFQLQRNSYRRKLSPIKKRPELFVRPKEIVLSNSVDRLKKNLELMSMLTGMEVQSYVAGDHCCIVYHIQYDSVNEVKHGLKIEMQGGVNRVTDSYLPLGFKYEAVTAEFDNIMTPACLGGIRKALVAYYSRKRQFEKLKRLINMDAELSKILDSSHIKISFYAKNQLQENEEQIKIVMMLDYRVYDITPKTITFEDTDLPVDAEETLNTQSVVFKKKPLHKAFKEAFIEGVGTYVMERPLSVQTQRQPQSRKRLRPNHANYNDDTFRPEDYSDQSEDDDQYA